MVQGRLQDKVALITGGGSGIGAAVAKVFCSEGAAVFLVDADLSGLDKTCRQIREATPSARVLSFKANVADHAEVEVDGPSTPKSKSMAEWDNHYFFGSINVTVFVGAHKPAINPCRTLVHSYAPTVP
jgi:NAD(P)-dependent dehydrogenase (short-subunit alcohol dehydrogenase family)